MANRPGEAGAADRLRPETRPADRPYGDDIRDRWANRPDRPFDQDWWNTSGGYGRWNPYWYRHPGYWAWAPATATALTAWLPWGWSQPYYYDYGSNVTYQDGYVYQGQQQVASAEDYAEQANQLALSVPADIDEAKVEWMPLGVFAIAEEGGADSGMLMQLAVSKDGLIAGTYHNETSGSDRPVEGMVDKQTQRAAWKFADDKRQDVVFETGIYNLTKDATKCLVHFGPDKTQTWSMVRLPAPQGDVKGQG